MQRQGDPQPSAAGGGYRQPRPRARHYRRAGDPFHTRPGLHTSPGPVRAGASALNGACPDGGRAPKLGERRVAASLGRERRAGGRFKLGSAAAGGRGTRCWSQGKASRRWCAWNWRTPTLGRKCARWRNGPPRATTSSATIPCGGAPG